MTHLDAVTPATLVAQGIARVGEARDGLAVDTERAPLREVPAHDALIGLRRVVVDDLETALARAQWVDPVAIFGGAHALRVDAYVVARSREASAIPTVIASRAGLVAVAAVVVVGGQIDAELAALSRSFGTATNAGEAHMGSFALITTGAAVFFVRGEIDAHVVALDRIFGAGALGAAADVVGGASGVTIAAKFGVGLQIDALFAAFGEVFEAFAGALVAHGVFAARKPALAAMIHRARQVGANAVTVDFVVGADALAFVTSATDTRHIAGSAMVGAGAGVHAFAVAVFEPLDADALAVVADGVRAARVVASAAVLIVRAMIDARVVAEQLIVIAGDAAGGSHPGTAAGGGRRRIVRARGLIGSAVAGAAAARGASRATRRSRPLTVARTSGARSVAAALRPTLSAHRGHWLIEQRGLLCAARGRDRREPRESQHPNFIGQL